MTIKLRKIVLVWGFILFLSGIASPIPNTKICRKRNGKFPTPGTYCKGYYECKNYVPFEKICPDGEHFNAIKERCDWEELYPCLEKKKDKECLRENGLFLKPGTNCKKYYRCCNGKAKEEICPGDTLFDPSKGNCEWSDLYTCIENRKDKECLKENGKFLKPGTNCKKYYRCSYGKAKLEVCPDDLLFDPSKEKCEWPDLYTCIERLSTTQKVSSTVTIFHTSTPKKASTVPVSSTSTVQKTSSSKPSTYSTKDPDFERTNSRIFETTTIFDTPSTTIDALSTSETSETPTVPQTTTSKISTVPPTTSQSIKTEVSTLTPTTTEIPTSQSTTTEISTLDSTTTEISTSQSTRTEISTLEPTTTEISTLEPTTTESSTTQLTAESSTLQPTSSEISVTSQTTSPQLTTTHSTNHPFSKKDKEGELTEPTLFETTTEVTFSPSTLELTTFDETNILCPEPNGYFPHPTNKHKFVGCVNNIPSVLTCPANLVYKHRLKRCDYE